MAGGKLPANFQRDVNMYGKIFSQIYEGSLRMDWKAMITFQQMIILCDKDGVLDMTTEALHFRTGIPLDIIIDGIRVLERPDKESRTHADEGRRIARIDKDRSWGWRIINHSYYRNLASYEEKKVRERKRIAEKRKQEKPNKNSDVAKCCQTLPTVRDVGHTDTDTNTDTNKRLKESGTFVPPSKEILTEASIKKINSDIEKLCERLYKHKIFVKVYAFKNKMLKTNKNERAILHTLSRCYLKRKFEKGGAWGYCMKIMQVENGNYNESDHNKTS